MNEKTIREYIELAPHYIAIGSTDIHLYKDADIPNDIWNIAGSVENGGLWRLSTPVSVRFTAPHPCGLNFSWSVYFESRDANGSGIVQFDLSRLREVMSHLSPAVVLGFAAMIEKSVLSLKERTREIQEALNKQMDSYDAALSLVEWAKDLSAQEGESK